MKNGYEKSFAAEWENTKASVNNLFAEFKKDPESNELSLKIQQSFEKLQRSAEFLQCQNLYRLFGAAAQVFSSVHDGYIFYSKRLERLLILIERNAENSFEQLLKTGEDSAEVGQTLEYCDRVSSGEIVDFSEAFGEAKEDSEDFSEWSKKAAQINSISTVEIERSHLEKLFNDFDAMISKTFSIEKEAQTEQNSEGFSQKNHKTERNIQIYSSNLRTEIEDMRDEIDRLRMLPFSTICGEIKNQYPYIEFDENIEKIRLDGEVLTTLVQVLPSFFQENHTDIKVHSVQGKYETTITIFDPDMKIDFEGIRKHALKLYPEIAKQVENASEKELSSFLFVKSFSSNTKLNHVLKLMDRVRGKVYIQNLAEAEENPDENKKGAKVVLEFPNSLSTRRGLFVQAGSHSFFIPANHIQDVVAKWRSELFVEQNQQFVNFEEEKIPVYRLSSLFKEKSSDSGLVNLLVIEYLEMKVAIAVDEVSAYSTITFRSLPEAFKDFNILSGMAVDNERRMIPILNTTELLIQLRGMRGFEMKKMDVLSKIDKPKILVVDDSDTSREIEGSILQANGFAVDEAADGILAMEKLKESKYSVIVTDTEMPRMNGLIFLENVRLLENYKEVPVIVITPNKDKALIESYSQAGASAFLNKNDFKRSELIELVKNFIRDQSY